MRKSYSELESENMFLRQILDDISDGVYAAGSDGTIIVYNKAVEEIENTNRAFVLGYNDREVYNVLNLDNYLRKELIQGRKPIKNRPLTYFMPNGYMVELVANAYPYFENDEITKVYCIMQDVSGINRLQKRIASLSSRLSQLHFSNDRDSSSLPANGTVYCFDDILGESEAMQRTKLLARRISASPSNVLIYGETGTGKELFAQSIHNESMFSEGPFIAVNCASIPSTLLESQLFGTVSGAFSGAKDMPGFFEQADGGTLFLDEINSMEKGLQAKILRVLQDKVVCRLGDKKRKIVNCRIICATNQNPLNEDGKAAFREDLLYRLMTLYLEIPPLRERRSDIPLLCRCFIEQLNQIYKTRIMQIDNELMDIFLRHDWPGNVRQLSGLLESCLCCLLDRGEVLSIEHIPPYLRTQMVKNEYHYCMISKHNLNSLLMEYEKKVVEESIKICDGNLSQAAKRLGISRQNMNYRMKKLDIDR